MHDRVLVTGAGGFIGSHLVEELLTQGREVRAMVRYTSSGNQGALQSLRPELRDGLEIVYGDIRDLRSVRELAQGCRTIFHLAALIGIPYSYRAPDSYVGVNVQGTLNVLEAARDLGIARTVITSTSEVYGTARYTPIDEKHPLQPQSPYSASKIGADHLALSYHSAFHLPVSVVRPFNTYGPRQSTRAIIPTIITQVLGADTIKLGNLVPVRDLVYVKDTAAGFVRIAESDATVGKVVNLATGRGVSVGDLVDHVQRLAGTSLPVIEEHQRLRPQTSEVFTLIGDATLAGELTGWRPARTLEEGLEACMEWFRSHRQDFREGEYAL